MPFAATMRSPALRPASAAGPPSITLPRRAGVAGLQKSKPRPRIDACGSVSFRRCSSSGTLRRRWRSCPSRPRTSMSVLPSPLTASNKPMHHVAVIASGLAVDAHEMIAAAQTRFSRACAEEHVAHHRGRNLAPVLQNTIHKTTMANRMFAAGPASITRIRCHGGLLPKARARSAAGHFAVAFVEHAHVAAERHRGDDVFGVIGRAADALVQRLAEAH